MAEKLFFERFLPELESCCPECKNHFAAGLVGPGSECFKFDDNISRDHDFFDGFYIWVTEEDDLKYGVKLNRVYNEITKEYGHKPERKSRGNITRGVKNIEEFFFAYLGRRGLPESNFEWFKIPSYSLAEATNGKIFYDAVGEFTAFQKKIKNMPEEVRIKKISALCALSAQSGQYNFTRLAQHNEYGAAALSLSEFVKNIAELIFLLNRRYMPYYKWALKGLKSLDVLGDTADYLTYLLVEPTNENTLTKKAEIIENISKKVAEVLCREGLSSSKSDYLEDHAYSVRAKLTDSYLSALHIMEKE